MSYKEAAISKSTRLVEFNYHLNLNTQPNDCQAGCAYLKKQNGAK